MSKTQDLYIEAKKIIPGGTQLLSKRPEQFLPNKWPAYYKKAKGCMVIDLDDKEYIDCSLSGIGSCILGYANDYVDMKVLECIQNGSMSTLNCPEEVELAQKLIELHPGMEMARFARTGGEAIAIAVRIARTYTKKDIILFCGYHGWHDWYLSSNLSNDKSLDGQLLPGLKPNGVPRGLKNTSIPFHFNNTKEFIKLTKKHKNRIAGIVIEPIRNEYAIWEFRKTIDEYCNKYNIPLICDEITCGFRIDIGGSSDKILDFNPDIIVLGKAISNGYPMSAIIGRRNIMQSAQDSFISSTYWTERIGPTAALATIKFMEDHNILEQINRAGSIIQKYWLDISNQLNIKIKVSGIPALSHFEFIHEKPLALKTLFTQEMLKKGFLASTSFYISYAHTDEIINKYFEAFYETFIILKNYINKSENEGMDLVGFLENGLQVCQSGFKRLN
jgi:glutamate-1-semialdehyde aminotransferase